MDLHEPVAAEIRRAIADGETRRRREAAATATHPRAGTDDRDAGLRTRAAATRPADSCSWFVASWAVSGWPLHWPAASRMEKSRRDGTLPLAPAEASWEPHSSARQFSGVR